MMALSSMRTCYAFFLKKDPIAGSLSKRSKPLAKEMFAFTESYKMIWIYFQTVHGNKHESGNAMFNKDFNK
jgi:hypothetical protein